MNRFKEYLRDKYALSPQGADDVCGGVAWTVVTNLAESLRGLPLSFFAHRDLAELTETMMSDVDSMEHVWSHVLGYLYGAYVSTVFVFAGLVCFDWRLAVACLWGVPVAFGLLYGTHGITRRNAIRFKADRLAVSDGIQELIENAREIRATNQERAFLDRLGATIGTFEKTSVRSELVTGLFVNAASVIMRLGVATTVLVGARLITKGQIDFMTFFMYLLAVSRIYAPFDQALVGPSGSGKSTCARLAARLWDHTEGSLTLGGIEVNTVDPETLMGSYSMVFQDVTLFDDSVMENIRLGRRGATDEDVLAAARAANCDEFVSRLPEGYATPIGENGARLSGGERQRISIARALLKDAPVVLLDEATASLDVENESKVQKALSELLRGRTVLVIAHRMRTVMGADHVVVLENGHVTEDGAPADLLARGGTFARMAALQGGTL
ncbi:MAG: ABC transporter ATP-binding protein [Olsenella sp.]|nr:ABC transporter ATP-binding protein [Olsenella sp.]